MPVVFGHEELAAVNRVVIAVCANLAALFARGAVGALAGVRVIPGWLLAAIEEVRDRHRNEIASVDRALAGILANDRGVVAARPRLFDADGHQLHLALRTAAWLVLDDVLVARHRADVRHRHFLLSG